MTSIKINLLSQTYCYVYYIPAKQKYDINIIYIMKKVVE